MCVSRIDRTVVVIDVITREKLIQRLAATEVRQFRNIVVYQR